MKKMKKLLYTLSILSMLTFIIPPIQTHATDWTTYTVHITKTGSKYHSAGCSYLKKSDISINIQDAINRGYTPCSRCNPPYPSDTSSSSQSTVSGTASYTGAYSEYTTEYNNRLQSGEIDMELADCVMADSDYINFASDEEAALYQSLSESDQKDYLSYKFLMLYDNYLDLLSYYAPVFDPDYYYNANPDIAATVGYSKTNLLKHFVESGMNEGRQGNADFNVSQYMTQNPELVEVYGDYLESYYYEYIDTHVYDYVESE